MTGHLCAHCRHCHVVQTARSTFWRCMRHDHEPARYAKYPRVPVIACPGHDEGAPAGRGA